MTAPSNGEVRSGSFTAERSVALNGDTTIRSGPSHLDGCRVLCSRSCELLQCQLQTFCAVA